MSSFAPNNILLADLRDAWRAMQSLGQDSAVAINVATGGKLNAVTRAIYEDVKALRRTEPLLMVDGKPHVTEARRELDVLCKDFRSFRKKLQHGPESPLKPPHGPLTHCNTFIALARIPPIGELLTPPPSATSTDRPVEESGRHETDYHLLMALAPRIANFSHHISPEHLPWGVARQIAATLAKFASALRVAISDNQSLAVEQIEALREELKRTHSSIAILAARSDIDFVTCQSAAISLVAQIEVTEKFYADYAATSVTCVGTLKVQSKKT